MYQFAMNACHFCHKYVDIHYKYVVSRSQTLFSRGGVIAFSISGALKAIMPLRESRVWLRETNKYVRINFSNGLPYEALGSN